MLERAAMAAEHHSPRRALGHGMIRLGYRLMAPRAVFRRGPSTRFGSDGRTRPTGRITSPRARRRPHQWKWRRAGRPSPEAD
jgi:hypothetical protein